MYEINKSNALIDLAKNPAASIERGVKDANDDFIHKQARFQEIYTGENGWHYPGVLKEEIEEKYKDYVWSYMWCGTGLHIKNMALDITRHEHNAHYVMAYNLELVKLIHRAENI